MSSNARAIIAVVLVGLIAICTILIVQKLVGNTRLDLTEHGIYTLSDGTRNILSGLGQDIKLKLFYSRVAAMKGPEGIRFYNNYYLYVRDLLDEYVGLSNGRLSLEVIDPRPYTDAEDEAARYGIRRFQLSEEEGFYFGLAAESELGKDAVIEFFEPDRQEFVEYDISKTITGVLQRDKKKIGVMSYLPVMGDDLSPYMLQMMQMQGREPRQPWTIVAHLREEYEVVSLTEGTTSIPEDIDYLLLIQPKGLGEDTLYAIDQFVMRGGKLIAFLDGYCLNDQPPRDPQNPYAAMSYDASSNLNALTEKWGVEMAPGVFAADTEIAIEAQIFRDQPPKPIITYLGLNDETVNTDEVMVAKLHDMRMLYAGVLRKPGSDEEAAAEEGEESETPPAEKEQETTYKVIPLLTTTPSGGGTWTPSGPYELQMPNPDAMQNAMVKSDTPVMVACLITGELESNFPDGPPSGATESSEDTAADDEESESGEPEFLAKSVPDASVMLVSDVDMISDMLAYSQTFFGSAQSGDNASLLLNALDYLGGSGELIAIRSRGRFQRPFTVVDEIEEAAEQQTADRVAEVNARIAQYEARLEQLGSDAQQGGDAGLLEGQALSERQEVQEEIRKARKELRQLNAGSREAIEGLGTMLQTINMILAPAAVLLIAVLLAVFRFAKSKRYSARRVE